MIIREIINEQLEKHYSDAGFKIRKIGTEEIYEDAIDLIELGYEYEETDIPIEDNNQDINYEYIEAAKILLGESEG